MTKKLEAQSQKRHHGRGPVERRIILRMMTRMPRRLWNRVLMRLRSMFRT